MKGLSDLASLNTRGPPAGALRAFWGPRLIGSAALLVTSSCWSQPASGPSLATCAAIADPAARLACYDRLAHEQGLAIAAKRGPNAAADGVRQPAHEGAAPPSTVQQFGLPPPRSHESPQPKSVTAKV